MAIINVRIDDRLVHGCVAAIWTPKLNIERIICIDDESASSQLLKNALRMATPKNVRLSVLTEDKAAENLQTDRYDTERCLIVCKAPSVLSSLVEKGVKISSVTLGNLGNQRRKEDSIPITRFLTVTLQDVNDLRFLHDKGISLIAQMNPEDTPVENFYDLVKRKVDE